MYNCSLMLKSLHFPETSSPGDPTRARYCPGPRGRPPVKCSPPKPGPNTYSEDSRRLLMVSGGTISIHTGLSHYITHSNHHDTGGSVASPSPVHPHSPAQPHYWPASRVAQQPEAASRGVNSRDFLTFHHHFIHYETAHILINLKMKR